MDIRLVKAEDKADWAALWEAYLAFYETARTPEVYDKTWERIMETSETMCIGSCVLRLTRLRPE